MSIFPTARILVFAKAPMPGAVKTRLIPAIGALGAARLQARLTRGAVSNAVNAGLCRVDIWCSPSMHHPFFRSLVGRYATALFQQQGVDLGERMAFAARKTLQRSDYVIIIGTDCPLLTAEDFRLTFERLQDGDDAILIPAEDGGYVLLGLRAYSGAIFEAITWGGPDVLNTTRRRMQTLGWRWSELDSHWDVDRPEDLERLKGVGSQVEDLLINLG